MPNTLLVRDVRKGMKLSAIYRPDSEAWFSVRELQGTPNHSKRWVWMCPRGKQEQRHHLKSPSNHVVKVPSLYENNT